MVGRISRECGLLAVAALWALGTGGVRADLPVAPGPDEGGTPVTLLDRHYEDDRDVLLALGELAFKSTAILSGNFGCDSCHPDGGTTSTLFQPGLSNKPGNIDMTDRALAMFEAGVFNPVNIPSLAGNRHTAPFGRHGQFETVEDFTRFAIVAEVVGSVPTELMLEAMVAFQESLALPSNPLLDDAGQLAASASDTARRSERIFRRPFPDSPAMSCVTCHQPLDEAERSALDAYIEAVGAVQAAPQTETGRLDAASRPRSPPLGAETRDGVASGRRLD